jgi:hypothetical protein
MRNMGEYEALIEIETLAALEETYRGEPWRWYSNGRFFMGTNYERTGQGHGVEPLWNRSPH